jgi:capsid protein
MSSNNTQVTTLYVEEFAHIIKLLSQQKVSRLRSAVMQGSHIGSQASPVDQIGPINANLVENRYGPMVPTDAPFARRWVFPSDYDIAQYLDSFDQLRLQIDPKSAMSETAVAALNRAMDSAIISGLTGTNYVGNAGTTTQSYTYSVSVQQGAASSTNLTVAKLIQAKLLLEQNEALEPGDEIYCAVNAVNKASLLKEVQYTNRDYVSEAVLDNGELVKFLGINFIHTELLTTGTDDQAGTSTAVPLWVKSGAYCGFWQDIAVKINERPDLRSIPWQVYVKATFGATRLEEKKNVLIWAH